MFAARNAVFCGLKTLTLPTAVIATITGLSNPRGIAVQSNGSRVWVANYNANTVSVINTATNTIALTLTGGTNPWAVAASPNGTRMYTSRYNGGSVNVFDSATTTDTVITTVPPASCMAIAVRPDSTKLYASDNSNDRLAVVDTASNSLDQYIALGSFSGPMGVAASNSKVFVAKSIGGIAVINTSTNTVSTTISLSSPKYLAMSPDGTKVYATSGSAVSVINTSTNAITNTITVGSNAQGLAVSPDNSRLYVANYADNTVSVINTSTNAVSATITVGTGPEHVAVSPDGTRVYAGNRGSNTVSVIG